MIPNIFHFIFGMAADFGGKPFSLIHYLAIKSAVETNKPVEVNFYYKYLPDTAWFDKIKPYLNLIEIEPVSEIMGNPIQHFAHSSDIVRLRKLQEFGGIYLDLDTICKRPFTNLLHHGFVIGIQGHPYGIHGLCNGVILSEKGHPFIEMWLDSYRTFRSKGMDSFYDEHSVILPLELCNAHPGLIHTEPYNSFHWPSWHDTHLLFEAENDYPNAYCHHLWASQSWQFCSKITVESIRDGNSTYDQIAKKFLS